MTAMRSRENKRTLTSDGRIEAAIGLIAALSSAKDGRVNADTASRELALQPGQLDDVIALLQLLSDRRTGSRMMIYRDGDDIVLSGSAGSLEPLRLTDDEALAMSLVLERYRLDDAVRARVAKALMPADSARHDTASASLIAGDALFGGFYQKVVEAQQDGVRCRILYRADHDVYAAVRVIDPGFIEVAGDTAYLIAWDIEKDAQRRYRLDRIADVVFTDESVVEHPFQRTSSADSLRAAGKDAQIRFASRAQAAQLDWAGLALDEGAGREDGAFGAPVRYATETWLFDHVLAAAGSICIEGPRDLRERFLAYAKNLL